MASKRQPGPTCQWSQPVIVEDGTMCRMASPLAGSIGISTSSVADWSLRTKLIESARRTIPKLPAESREQFAALFSPTNIAITGGVLTLWAASHLTGAGEVADIVLLVIGLVGVGTSIFGAARHIGSFLAQASNAESEADLNSAANHLAQAVVTIGVVAFIALIAKAGSRFKGAGQVGEEAGLGKVAGSPEKTVTVGRWMSQKEYDAMMSTRRVQESPTGGKSVSFPSNPANYKAAPPGDFYVEFDVPESSLSGKSVGQMVIPGPNSLAGRLARQKGLPPPKMPPATNIRKPNSK